MSTIDDIVGCRIAQWNNGVLSSPLTEDWVYGSFYWPKYMKEEHYPNLICLWKIKSIKNQ